MANPKQMATAAAAAETPAAAEAAVHTGGMSIGQLLGKPEAVNFRIVVDAKSYPDRNDASVTTTKIAFADVNLGGSGMLVQCGIYKTTKTTQEADGVHARSVARLSLPKGIELPKGETAAVEVWKTAVIGRFVDLKRTGAIQLATTSTGGLRAGEAVLD